MRSSRLPAAAVLAVVLLFCSACGAAKDDDGKGGATPSSTPSTASAAELLTYDEDDAGGVRIATAAEVSRLEGAPDDFKQFVAGIVDASKTPPDDDCPFSVGVARVDTSGFAAGSLNSCGGAAIIWAKQEGVWQEIWSGQEYPACADLKKHSVPKDLADKCYAGKDMTEPVDYTG